jgi:PhnB protein
MSIRAIPKEYAAVTPHLMLEGVAQAIEFYKTVFNAKERMRIPGPDNLIAHAEIVIGESVIMLGDACPRSACPRGGDGESKIGKGPHSFGGSPVSLHLYVEDVDTVFKNAIASGAKEIRPLKNQIYGDRSGLIQDPFGHLWNIATHVEDVSEEELKKRMANMTA